MVPHPQRAIHACTALSVRSTQPAAGTIDSDDELASTRRPRSSPRSLRRKRAVVYTQLCAVTDARKTAGKRSKATFSTPFDGSGGSRVEQLAFFGCELVEDLKLWGDCMPTFWKPETLSVLFCFFGTGAGALWLWLYYTSRSKWTRERTFIRQRNDMWGRVLLNFWFGLVSW